MPFPVISGKWCEFGLKNKFTNGAPWKSNRGFRNLLFILLLFVFADGVWKLRNVPNRILFNGNHACSCMYTREITVIEHRHAKRERVIFLVIRVFVELFTVMVRLSFFGLRCTARRKLEIYNL